MTTGIYCIRNCVDNKRYVGSASRSLWGRIRDHKKALNEGTHRNRYLQRAWKKHGPHTFVFSILEKCAAGICLTREQYWMNFYDSFNPSKGYNICKIAGSVLGIKFTEESRARVSAANRARSPESRKKHADTLRGRNHTQDHKTKISEGLKHSWQNGSRKGWKHSEETKQKISNTQQTPEHKARASAIAKKRGISKETMAKIIERKRTPEMRAKARMLAIRRGISPETRAKMIARRKEIHGY